MLWLVWLIIKLKDQKLKVLNWQKLRRDKAREGLVNWKEWTRSWVSKMIISGINTLKEQGLEMARWLKTTRLWQGVSVRAGPFRVEVLVHWDIAFSVWDWTRHFTVVAFSSWHQIFKIFLRNSLFSVFAEGSWIFNHLNHAAGWGLWIFGGSSNAAASCWCLYIITYWNLYLWHFFSFFILKKALKNNAF